MILMGMHTIYNVTTGILSFSPVDTSHLNTPKCFKCIPQIQKCGWWKVKYYEELCSKRFCGGPRPSLKSWWGKSHSVVFTHHSLDNNLSKRYINIDETIQWSLLDIDWCDLVKKGFSKALQRPSYKALQTSTKEGRKAHVVQSSDDRASSPYSRGRGYGGAHWK